MVIPTRIVAPKEYPYFWEKVVEKLKQHCKRLVISVPMLEPPGFWGPHHRLHMLDESFFPGFKFKFIDGDGNLTDEPTDRGNLDSIKLMLCIWDKPVDETSN